MPSRLQVLEQGTEWLCLGEREREEREGRVNMHGAGWVLI